MSKWPIDTVQALIAVEDEHVAVENARAEYLTNKVRRTKDVIIEDD